MTALGLHMVRFFSIEKSHLTLLVSGLGTTWCYPALPPMDNKRGLFSRVDAKVQKCDSRGEHYVQSGP